MHSPAGAQRGNKAGPQQAHGACLVAASGAVAMAAALRLRLHAGGHAAVHSMRHSSDELLMTAVSFQSRAAEVVQKVGLVRGAKAWLGKTGVSAHL